MKKVLVTGAAGFIGSHLVNYHLNQGDQVIGLDNFCSSDWNSKHFNEFKKNKRFKFYCLDICDKKFVDIVFEENKNINIVYNFACPASPPIYQNIPIQTLLTCTQGYNNILFAAKSNNKNVIIIQASTSEVYGDPDISPQSESYRGNVNPYGIRSNYDEGKRAAEALSFDYLNKENLDVRVVRLFNCYGPWMDKNDGRVVTNFINQALNNENLTIYGSGKQTRSFCFIEDTLKGIIKLGELKENPKTPINIGNPIEFTIFELSQILLELLPECKSLIDSKPLPSDDPTQRRPDISLAKKLLNWEPKVQLKEGLIKMISWAKENGW